MCKLFDEWRNEIKDYCRQQGLNFDTAEKLSQSWNKNTVALSYRDPSKGSNGLLDDTPCPLVLLIRREKNGKLVFEQTEHTKKYLAQFSFFSSETEKLSKNVLERKIR